MGTDVRLSESKICEIVGVSQQQRQSLVKRGLLQAAPQGGCRLVDALELASVSVLSSKLSASAAALAWKQLQPELRRGIAGPRLELVVDLELGSAAVARTDAELATAVLSGRPVKVIELGSRLQEIGDAYRRWIEVSPHAPRQRRGARSSRRATS
jgi:hypothetical protein